MWTILRHDGPNHLRLWLIRSPNPIPDPDPRTKDIEIDASAEMILIWWSARSQYIVDALRDANAWCATEEMISPVSSTHMPSLWLRARTLTRGCRPTQPAGRPSQSFSQTRVETTVSTEAKLSCCR